MCCKEERCSCDTRTAQIHASPESFARDNRGGPAMTNIFAVVGEHRVDPDRLLVVGQDGNTYDYNVPADQLLPTEPREDDWQVDTTVLELENLFFDELK